MKKNQIGKEAVVKEITEKIKKAKAIVFVDYKGINVQEDTALRNEFRNSKADYHVYKNRLMQRALESCGITGCEQYLNGTTSFAFGYENEISAPKVAIEGAKKIGKISVKCGIYQGKLVDLKFVEQLASTPSKEELIAKLLFVLNEPVASLARVLKAVSEK